jgi:hypothetical protein
LPSDPASQLNRSEGQADFTRDIAKVFDRASSHSKALLCPKCNGGGRQLIATEGLREGLESFGYTGDQLFH